MDSWLQATVAGTALSATGWIFVQVWMIRSRLGHLEEWRVAVDRRDQLWQQDVIEIKNGIATLHDRVNQVLSTVADNDSQTAKAIGRLEGRMETALKK